MKKANWKKRLRKEFTINFGKRGDGRDCILVRCCEIEKLETFISQQISLAKKEMGQALRKKVYNVTQEKFDMAIGDSRDFERGFRQGFEVCWSKILDATKK